MENIGKRLELTPDWAPRCAPLSLYKAALDILQGTCGLENSLMLWSPKNPGVDFHRCRLHDVLEPGDHQRKGLDCVPWSSMAGAVQHAMDGESHP